MNVFREGMQTPGWCTVREFRTISLGAKETIRATRRHPNEFFFATYGVGLISSTGQDIVIREQQFFMMPEGTSEVSISGTGRPVDIIRFGGDWGAHVYGASLFRVGPGVPCPFAGDPVTYPKNTAFDAHYHDYDEYWFIIEGSGVVVVGDEKAHVRSGDCIAIGAGYHHDFPLIDWPVKALAFEVSITGQKRLGHLWTHTHGPAIPHAERR